MRRREFITGIGVAVCWPRVTLAQSSPAPVIGFLDGRSSDGMGSRLAGFRLGLKEAGFIEGENVQVEYRWADNQADRLPHMAAELVQRRVSVIVGSGPLPSAAAKAATTTIPIVFMVGEDPTRLGLVSSLTRPTDNLSGVNLFANELEAKRFELLRQLAPQAIRIALLINSNDERNAETTLHDVSEAARRMGVQLQVLTAGTVREIADVFAALPSPTPQALFVGASAFLNSRRVQLVQQAAFHRLPAAFALRDAAEAGGLMSYGPDIVDAFRQGGIYAGRILKGAKPADLPVIQASKYALVINTTTARMLGLTVPPSLLAIADEVIE
jgi:putative ABC transport system substrate-binding protein